MLLKIRLKGKKAGPEIDPAFIILIECYLLSFFLNLQDPVALIKKEHGSGLGHWGMYGPLSPNAWLVDNIHS